MNAFEKLIGKTFDGYRVAKKANLYFLFPPMRVAGMMGKAPCFVQTGKAPYDVGGYLLNGYAKAVGVELKETADHATSLSIIAPDKKGSGLHYHQLDSLVAIHEAGGYAALLWSNGGEIGRADGEVLSMIKTHYDTSLKLEATKKTVPRGSRSILWGHFKPVKIGHEGFPLWLE